MTAFSDSVVLKSPIHLNVLYNQKIERIRVLEYENRSAPMPVKFDVSENYSGSPSKKMVTLVSESAPKPY